MKRITVNEYRRLAFVGKPPCANTIKRWIDNGTISGEKIGGLYFVHVGDAPRTKNNPLLKSMIEG